MTEKKMDFLETWLIENGFRKNNYDEVWYFGDNPQQKLNEIISRYEGRDPKM